MSLLSTSFELQEYKVPGEHLDNVAKGIPGPCEVAATAIMRDYITYRHNDNGLVVVVGDMANNLTGTTYQDEELAADIGLSPSFKFNGGLLGSLALQVSMGSRMETGTHLIKAANDILADTYRKYGVGVGEVDVDPAERFTGYLTHVRMNTDETIITSVGDVNAWVNGDHVAGEEKAVDTEKDQLIDNVTATLELEGWQRAVHIQNIISEFARVGELDASLATHLYHVLIATIEDAETLSRQTVYRPVDNLVTPWQIRTLQNAFPGSRPWAYGAIDGTSTPEDYIRTLSIPTNTIDSLVIATDGSKPQPGSTGVHSMADLEVVNPVFSEQGVAVLTRRA